jgi:hypothetical protein
VLPAAVPAVSGQVLKVNTFSFSGALVGVLHILPAKNCQSALPRGVTLSAINGRLKGSSSTGWTIQVVTPGNGTFKLPEGENAGIVVLSSPQDQVWGSNSASSTSSPSAR